MPTIVDLDDALVDEAKRLGKHRSEREAVHAALAEYVARRRRPHVVIPFLYAGWDDAYDYKAERKRRD